MKTVTPYKKNLIDLFQCLRINRYLIMSVDGEILLSFFWREKDTQQIGGLCGLRRRDDGLELSYTFFPILWGKGFAKEVTRACLNYGFTKREDDSIVSITQEANHGSCHLLESIGMKHIGIFYRFNAIQRLYQLTRPRILIKI